MSKIAFSREDEEVILIIDKLSNFKDIIIRLYKKYIDPDPIAGWLAMYFELHKKGIVRITSKSVLYKFKEDDYKTIESV